MRMEDLNVLSPPHGPVGASQEVYAQIGHLTRLLHDALQQLGVMPHLRIAADNLPDARSRLNYVAKKTGDAAEKVLNSLEMDEVPAGFEFLAGPATRVIPQVAARWSAAHR